MEDKGITPEELKAAKKQACLGLAAAAHTTCRAACNAWCKQP